MAIKVYGRPLSPFVRVALLVLTEKGIDFELVVGDQKAPEYLANINPFGKHPALEIDGFILYESRAIARFIATKYESQGPNLLGSTPEEKALVDQWVEVEGHTFQPPVLQVNIEKYFKPVFMKKETDEANLQENYAKVEKVLDVYDTELAKSKYLAGNFYSMADMLHLPMLHYLILTGNETLVTSRKHVNAWWDEISSRPAWKEVVEKYSTP